MLITNLLGFIAFTALSVPSAAFHLMPHDLWPRHDSCDGWGIWTSGGLNSCTDGTSSATILATTGTAGINEPPLTPLFLTTTHISIITTTVASPTIVTTTLLTSSAVSGVSNSVGPKPCVSTASPAPVQSPSAGQSPGLTPCNGKDCTTSSSPTIMSPSPTHTVPTVAHTCPVCSIAGTSVDATSSDATALSSATTSILPPVGSEHATTKTEITSSAQANPSGTTSKTTTTHSASSSVRGSETAPPSSETSGTPVTGFSAATRPVTAIVSVFILMMIQVVVLW